MENTIKGPEAQALLEEALGGTIDKDETQLDIKALLQGISAKLSNVERLLTKISEATEQNQSGRVIKG